MVRLWIVWLVLMACPSYCCVGVVSSAAKCQWAVIIEVAISKGEWIPLGISIAFHIQVDPISNTCATWWLVHRTLRAGHVPLHHMICIEVSFYVYLRVFELCIQQSGISKKINAYMCWNMGNIHCHHHSYLINSILPPQTVYIYKW